MQDCQPQPETKQEHPPKCSVQGCGGSGGRLNVQIQPEQDSEAVTPPKTFFNCDLVKTSTCSSCSILSFNFFMDFFRFNI